MYSDDFEFEFCWPIIGLFLSAYLYSLGTKIGLAAEQLLGEWLLCFRKMMESSDDECEYSDDDDEDNGMMPARRCATALPSSTLDTSLLHRNRAGVRLPTVFDDLSDVRDVPFDGGHQLDERLDSFGSTTAAVSELTRCQPFIYADGVDNELDSTTYF